MRLSNICWLIYHYMFGVKGEWVSLHVFAFSETGNMLFHRHGIEYFICNYIIISFSNVFPYVEETILYNCILVMAIIDDVLLNNTNRIRCYI